MKKLIMATALALVLGAATFTTSAQAISSGYGTARNTLVGQIYANPGINISTTSFSTYGFGTAADFNTWIVGVKSEISGVNSFLNNISTQWGVPRTSFTFNWSGLSGVNNPLLATSFTCERVTTAIVGTVSGVQGVGCSFGNSTSTGITAYNTNLIGSQLNTISNTLVGQTVVNY
jgi:hypothetical protein